STPRPSAGHRIAAALDGLPARSVIASDPATSYLVSAFTDHFVVVTLDQHGSPSDSTVFERMARVRDLFDPRLPLEASAAWLTREQIDYILLDAGGFEAGDFFGVTAFLEPGAVLEKLRSRPDCLSESQRGDGMHLFAVVRQWAAALDTAASIRMPRECPRAQGDAPPMRSLGPFTLARFETKADTVSAGDTVAVEFCWTLDAPVGFGLPYYWTLRFDSPFPRGALYGEWYGKQYRRLVERRNGEFYRFTASGRIASGTALPDVWPAGAQAAQSASFVLPRSVAPGVYTIRVCVEQRAYLPNRTPADYLRNEDSLWGEATATVTVTALGSPRKD
ncbi:MAG: hypothetical protein PHQ19_08235, partial [Candidatus Krumholzibacteria bacterium]|nr:hypothetical protein [Candidatus Krumholzibacteria bacterium]